MPLSPWLDLIMESPGISDTEIHRIKLPKPFLSQILLTSQLGLYLGRLSESGAEDFEREVSEGYYWWSFVCWR